MMSNKRGGEGEEVAGVPSSDWWLGGSIRAREMEEKEKNGCWHSSWEVSVDGMEKMTEKERVETSYNGWVWAPSHLKLAKG